jgi:hypothetical protein
MLCGIDRRRPTERKRAHGGADAAPFGGMQLTSLREPLYRCPRGWADTPHPQKSLCEARKKRSLVSATLCLDQISRDEH